MLNPDFDPLAIIQDLQINVDQLRANQDKLVQAVNHQASALQNLHKSFQGNFELIFEQSRRIDQLTLELMADRQKKPG
jgi:hypothetical protein